MATRRNKIMDAPINPAIMPGLIFLADTVDLTATKVLTVTFPAKTVLAVLASSTADTDAEKIVWAASVTNNVATVTFTATSAGASNVFSYLIVASVTETITVANSIVDDTSYTPVG
jgi:hypothetical protein